MSVPIQTFFCAFMVNHSLAAKGRVVFVCSSVGCAPILYRGLGPFSSEFVWGQVVSPCLVAFADDVPVPIRDFNHEISSASRHALAAQAALGSEAGREGQLVLFGIAHFR